MSELDLSHTNPEGTWGKWDVFWLQWCCGGEWVGGYGAGSGRVVLYPCLVSLDS